MAKSVSKSKPMPQNEEFAKILLFIRHVRNFHDIGPHPIRAEAVAAEGALERALGKQMEQLYKTKTWKNT